MLKKLALLMAGLLIGSLLMGGGNANAVTSRSDAPSAAQVPMREAAVAAASAWSCPSGNVCFWDGANGTGNRCSWNIADSDWRGGLVTCSWSAQRPVRSIRNAGTSSASGVAYYLSRNYVNRVGCTRQGSQGNLAGTYLVYSHRWVSGSCG